VKRAIAEQGQHATVITRNTCTFTIAHRCPSNVLSHILSFTLPDLLASLALPETG